MSAGSGSGATYVVRAGVPVSVLDALEREEDPLWEAVVVWREAGAEHARLEVYHEQLDAAACASRALDSLLGRHLPPGGWNSAIDEVQASDWAESWKVHFGVLKASPRLIVRPTWEPYHAAKGEAVITLDPGMSFGTGQHFTTRSCLQLLDAFREHYRGRDVLDAGCGSGILGIAALKLGARSVLGVDCDATAVAIAEDNARLNDVDPGRVQWQVVDLVEGAPDSRYALVVANILADVLIRIAGHLVAVLEPAPGGRLVVAGILASQFPAVRQAFQARGLQLTNLLTDGEWVTAAFERAVESRSP